MKVGIAQWVLNSSNDPTSVGLAASLGFHSIHLNAGLPKEPGYLGRREIVQIYQELSEMNNISIGAISVNLIETEGFLVSPSGEISSVLKRVIDEIVFSAAELKTKLIYFPCFSQSEIRTEEDFQKMVKILKYACDSAQSFEIQIATENTLSAAENEKLLAQVNRNNLRILLDLYNPILWGHSVIDFIDRLFRNLADQIHVKDGIHRMGDAQLGHGNAGLAQSLNLLLKKGFVGSFVLENDYINKEFRIIKNDLLYLNSILQATTSGT